MDKNIEIQKLTARMNLLISRGRENQQIVKKIQRQIYKLQGSEKPVVQYVFVKPAAFELSDSKNSKKK